MNPDNPETAAESTPAKKPNRSVGPAKPASHFAMHRKHATARPQRFYQPLRFKLFGGDYERQFGGVWYERRHLRVPTGKVDAEKKAFYALRIELRRIPAGGLTNHLEAEYHKQYPAAAP